MLGLGAVDVHRLVVGDGNHEHGRVAGLSVVVPPLPPALAALGLALGFPGMGWKSEKMAFCSGWQGLLAVDEATEWF